MQILEWIKYRREMARLEKKKQNVAKDYDIRRRGVLKDAEPAGSNYRSLLSDEEDEQARIDDEILETTSFYLIRTAQNLNLPTPKYPSLESWERSHKTALAHLTADAMAALQSSIRKEHKERLELWELRVKIFAPALTASVGLIGALIGLVAIFKK